MVRTRQRRTRRELRSLSRQTEELRHSRKICVLGAGSRAPATPTATDSALFPDKYPDENQDHDYNDRANRQAVHRGLLLRGGIEERFGLYNASDRKCKQYPQKAVGRKQSPCLCEIFVSLWLEFLKSFS